MAGLMPAMPGSWFISILKYTMSHPGLDLLCSFAIHCTRQVQAVPTLHLKTV